jgi:hypothetical protein
VLGTTFDLSIRNVEKKEEKDPKRPLYGRLYISGSAVFFPYFIVNNNAPHFFKCGLLTESRFFIYNKFKGSMLRYLKNGELKFRNIKGMEENILSQVQYEEAMKAALDEEWKTDVGNFFDTSLCSMVHFLKTLYEMHPNIDELANKRIVSGAFIILNLFHRLQTFVDGIGREKNDAAIIHTIQKIVQNGTYNFLISKATTFSNERESCLQRCINQ